MGQSGSYTIKAVVNPLLFQFTNWDMKEIYDMKLRGQRELSDTFSLNKNDFDFLIGRELVDRKLMKNLFEVVFEKNNLRVADKLEVMCVMCIISKISNLEKINFLFDLFNFNDKGYLLETELLLLFQSVTFGISKADPKFIKPSELYLNQLLLSALTIYAKIDQGKSIRKPELIKFATEYIDVHAYLDAWTGHANQVLLIQGTKWRDLSFPANTHSIYTDSNMLKMGLPPERYTCWKRLGQLSNERGSSVMFSHQVSYLKNVDRKRLYNGLGCLASGFLKQGILADRWLLNAIATCASNPTVIQSLFGYTGQEADGGRYCVRLFEGFRWNSIFIDDRIPCDLFHVPLFSSSSDTSESWVLLIEKAIAKYFDSYGSLGSKSVLYDSLFQGLRLLSGGHITYHSLTDFHWDSVGSGQHDDGMKYIVSLIDEGAMVSFGRSELNAYSTETLRSNPKEGLPYGYLYPVVGYDLHEGHQRFIFKDIWGLGTHPIEVLFTDTPDKHTGHCRIFHINAETLEKIFDTVVICRFPDYIRYLSMSENKKRTLWTTKILGSKSNNVHDPAAFILQVYPTPVLNKKKVVQPSNALLATDQNSGESLRIKFAITFSSACPWNVAGSKIANASLRLRIVPVDGNAEIGSQFGIFISDGESIYDCTNSIQLFDKGLVSMKRNIGKPSIHNIRETDGSLSSSRVSARRESHRRKSSTSTHRRPSEQQDAKLKHDSIEEHKAEPETQNQTEVIEIGEQCCWKTINLELSPGAYRFYIDISYDLSNEQLKKILGHTKEKMNLESEDSISPKDILIQISSIGLFECNVYDLDSIYRDVTIEKPSPKEFNLSGIPIRTMPFHFYTETQSEVASKVLINKLKSYHEESEVIGASFHALARDYKKLVDSNS